IGSVVSWVGSFLNGVFSFVVFAALDAVDIVLCYVYRAADLYMEAERRKPCYCSSPAKQTLTCSTGGKIVMSGTAADPKVFRLTRSKLQLEEISDTLFTRPSVISEISGKEGRRARVTPTYTVNSNVVGMLQERIVGQYKPSSPRWSDCDCSTCTSWVSPSRKEALFVNVAGATDKAQEDVVFIHGFISSSAFWTETVYPNFSAAARAKYRFLAVDLLGFGRSPKPADSLYTLREHVEMIERSVLEAHRVKSFHIVAHSLGCIIALALATKHRGCVKSLTLLAPPYFPPPRGEHATQYMMRRLAPRRLWPVMGFGASVACWYEHVSRTVSLVFSKNHRRWEYLAKLITGNRMRTYLIEAFFTHTHNAAWHTLHNVIFGTAGRMDGYLDDVNTRLKCDITLFHGREDTLIPVECSRSVKSRVSRAKLRLVDGEDHITIVVGRQKAFAEELEGIWNNAA
ncbi:hypothetical protein M569_17561, partial [Genlisea aurea]